MTVEADFYKQRGEVDPLGTDRTFDSILQAIKDYQHGDLVSIGPDDHHPQIQTSDDGSAVVDGPSDINFGQDLSVTDDGDGTITVDASGSSQVSDTRTDVSENGSTVVSDTEDINFTNLLGVTDDGDGSVTVSVDSLNLHRIEVMGFMFG